MTKAERITLIASLPEDDPRNARVDAALLDAEPTEAERRLWEQLARESRFKPRD